MPTFYRLVLLLFLAVSSPPLTTASPLPTRSNTTYYGLIFAPKSGCTPNQRTQVMDAITDMRSLSTSAISALESSNTLSSYFFQQSYFAPASAVFNATLFATQPLQDLPTDSSLGYSQIQLYCAHDTDTTCGKPSPGANSDVDKTSTTPRWGYIRANPVFGQGSVAQLYACPALLNRTLPRNTPSCAGAPGLATIGWALLRTFIQLKTLQDNPKLATLDTISDRAPGVRQSHALVMSGSNDYRLNADNFAELALWAWDVGASRGNASQSFQCPGNVPFKTITSVTYY